MDDTDPIKKLFQETGWSYSEILKKLEMYKTNSQPSDSANSKLENSEKSSANEDTSDCFSQEKPESIYLTNKVACDTTTFTEIKENTHDSSNLNSVHDVSCDVNNEVSRGDSPKCDNIIVEVESIKINNNSSKNDLQSNTIIAVSKDNNPLLHEDSNLITSSKDCNVDDQTKYVELERNGEEQEALLNSPTDKKEENNLELVQEESRDSSLCNSSINLNNSNNIHSEQEKTIRTVHEEQDTSLTKIYLPENKNKKVDIHIINEKDNAICSSNGEDDIGNKFEVINTHSVIEPIISTANINKQLNDEKFNHETTRDQISVKNDLQEDTKLNDFGKVVNNANLKILDEGETQITTQIENHSSSENKIEKKQIWAEDVGDTSINIRNTQNTDKRKGNLDNIVEKLTKNIDENTNKLDPIDRNFNDPQTKSNFDSQEPEKEEQIETLENNADESECKSKPSDYSTKIKDASTCIFKKYKKLGNNTEKAEDVDRIPKPVEQGIRDKLNEQLELLRQKKSTQEAVSATKPAFTFPFAQRNVQRLNQITNSLFQKLNADNLTLLLENDEADNKRIDEPVAGPSKINDLSQHENVLHSNETDLMIVNVIGGYKSPTPERTRMDIDVASGSGTTSLNMPSITVCNRGSSFIDVPESGGITPTKTMDVTKIKGWKKKKFALSKPSDKIFHQLYSGGEVGNENSVISKDNSFESPSKSNDVPQQTQSAFISDELDQFLTKNAQLNISYEVPKLEAEQTIVTNKYIDIKFPEYRKEPTSQPSLVAKSKTSYKPKTLAEKRKMLAAKSKNPESTDYTLGMNSRQKKKYEDGVLRMRKKLIDENVPFTRRCFLASTDITSTHSFVVFNGKKLKVPSLKKSKIIIKIQEKNKSTKESPHRQQLTTPERKSHSVKHRKPSLLNDLKSDFEKVQCDDKNWEIVKMKVPKLYLNLRPQIGKRIHPKIEHLIHSDGITLSEDRVEFALSMLRTKNTPVPTKLFNFPLKYTDDTQYITMRKRIPISIHLVKAISKPNITETEPEINKTVEDIMAKILNYIEISENTKDVVRDEEDIECNEMPVLLPIQTILEDKDLKRKRKTLYGPKSANKIALELKKLNCKLLQISTDEEQAENMPCLKEFCKYGCICKSIECKTSYLLPTHCGLPKCMFKCRCKFKNTRAGENVSLPTGTNIFSEGIINRLQDEATKDLAKVEKEFTQTVIKTDNHIIMVGDTTERRRRATKMPKKYVDYIDEEIDYISPPQYVLNDIVKHSTIDHSKDKTINIDEDNSAIENIPAIQSCQVLLIKYDFAGIMPFCMVHSLYKCHCKYKSVFDTSKDTSIINCTYISSPSPTKPAPASRNTIKSKCGRAFNKELFSSRTRGLATSYYLVRNKSISHKCKIRKNSKHLERKLKKYLVQNAKNILDDAQDECELIEEFSKTIGTCKDIKSRRKQSLVVMDDGASLVSEIPKEISNATKREQKIQRRKTKPFNRVSEVVKTTDESPPQAPPGGETQKVKAEFLALLGKRPTQLRLLPWKTLMCRYANGTFQLWHSNTSKLSPLIVTENGTRPSTHHYNIKLFEHMNEESAMPSDIIRWIIKKKIPLGKSPDNLLLVLAFSKNWWEICGLCEKIKSNNESKGKLSISLIGKWINSESNPELENNTDPPLIDLAADEDGENLDDKKGEQPETLVHENLQENKKILYCSKRRYQTKKLTSEKNENDPLKSRQIVWASVPGVTAECKWRVINMNVEFAYLSLSRCSYTIKFEDIMRAIKIAKDHGITIVLKSEELQTCYPHKYFGIYCAHNYSDKIFVGPYSDDENHDLDTLSFVNNVLINTNLFNRIKGKRIPGGGLWFFQAKTKIQENKSDDDVVIIQQDCPTVDLTCESDEEQIELGKNDDKLLSKQGKKTAGDVTVPKDASSLLKHILYKPFDEETMNAEKALDNVMEKGKINVNKPISPLTKINEPASQSLATPENTNSRLSKTRDSIDDSSQSDTEKLMIDEDIEVEQYSSDDLTCKEKSVPVTQTNDCIQNVENVRYLVSSNVARMGYILAYQEEHSEELIVTCPITKKKKTFQTPRLAITSLERALAKRFILVPSTFKLIITMVDKLPNYNALPLQRSILNGFHIIGSFGVKNIMTSTAIQLKQLGIKHLDVHRVLYLREKKLFWGPLCQLGKLLNLEVDDNQLATTLANILNDTINQIVELQSNSTDYIKEKIDLEFKKVTLVETYSRLIEGLPQQQKKIAQKELDRIINFSCKDRSSSESSNNLKLDNYPQKSIEVIEFNERSEDGDAGMSQSTCTTQPVSITKKLTDLQKETSTSKNLSGTNFEITSPIAARSLLTEVAPNKRGKFVMVTKKRNGTEGNTVELNKLPDSLTPPSISPKNDMLQNGNSSSKTQKHLVIPSISVLTSVPKRSYSNNLISKIKSSGTETLLKTSPQKKFSLLTSGSTKFPSPPKAFVMKSSMATLTPVVKQQSRLILKKDTAKNTPNYIAIKEAGNYKYFQLVSETTASVNPSKPTIKRPSTSVMVQPPPVKKMSPSTTSLSNSNTKTEK